MASTSSSGVLARTWSPQTPEERELVLQQLDRILSNPVFRSSKRYPALLKFVVEQTLDGRVEDIKERVLGIEVFGRSPDYDTNSDHVVRTAAGEVRKRLAQYYMEAGRDDEIRIDVPSGSYVAQFRLASENLSVRQMAAAAMPALQPVPVPIAVPAVAPTPQLTLWQQARLPFILSLAGAAILAIIVALSGRLTSGSASNLQKFWDPVFNTPGPVLICIGLRDGRGGMTPSNVPPQNVPAQTTAAAGTNPQTAAFDDPLMHRVSMADLLALARVTDYVGERHSAYRILNPVSTSFADLRHEPTVLIGVGNNDWTKQVAGRLRFSFLAAEGRLQPQAIMDRQNPARNDWVAHQGPVSGTYKDYAVVSRLLDPRVEQIVVIVGGLGPHGTEAAGEFVTSADQMKKLDGYAPSDWKGKNLQVVLSTEVVKGSSGPPKIEAAYFW